jgi:hypothetical protein
MKAKDLRGKNIEDIEEGAEAPEESFDKTQDIEEDAVAAAYENISKKLDSIRNGKAEESDEQKESEESGVEDLQEPELEEWKGPKKPTLKDVEPEEEEADIPKVKLHNLEDPKEEESEEPNEVEVPRVSKVPRVPQGEKEWEPKENDPLDEEDGGEETEAAEDELEKEVPEEKMKKLDGELDSEEDSADVKNEDEMEEDNSKNLRTAVPEPDLDEVESRVEMSETKEPQPDTLDDLAEVRGGRPMAGGSEDEDEYYIPSLKTPRQEGSNLSYNTHPQREGIGQSYSPKGSNMDGNDPNNYFSQHQQPQASKRANKFHLLVLVIIGIAVIGFTVYILKGGFGEISMTTEPSPSPSASAVATPEPFPSPKTEIDRSKFTIRVLNGTKITGLAGTVNDKLKELGYETANPGNATNSAFTQTVVRVKEGTEAASLLQRLIEDLAPDYQAVEGTVLDKSTIHDAEVIIGKK